MTGAGELQASSRRQASVIFDVRYATRADGARTAYGLLGSGPPLLFPPGMLSTLEWASDSPEGRGFFNALAEHRTVIAYDRHGCGLSDRDRTEFTLADDMKDLDAVLNAVGHRQFDVVSGSLGAVPAVMFAAGNPERIRRLVLCESTLTQARPTPRQSAMRSLMEIDPEANFQSLVGLGFPRGIDGESFQSVLRFLRTAATPEVLLKILHIHETVDHLLPAIKAPTLVIHRKGDAIAPFETARELASSIPNARLVPMGGDEHIPWYGDWQSMVEQIVAFLLAGDQPDGNSDTIGDSSARSLLSPRELEVLRMIAAGKSNPEIAEALVISVNTVQRHVSNILQKAELRNRAEAVAYAIRNRLV